MFAAPSRRLLALLAVWPLCHHADLYAVLPPVTSDLQLQLTADVGPSTSVDGDDVLFWDDQAHGHVFNNANATLPTYVADSGGGVPAIDLQRSSGFVGDFRSSAGPVIGDATIFIVARFDGYTHSATSSSYFFSIDSKGGPPNNSEHTLARDQQGANNDVLYHWRGQPAPEARYGSKIIEDAPGGIGEFNYYTSIFRGTDDGGGAVSEMEAWINGSNGATDTPDLTHNGSGYSAAPSLTRIGLWTSGGSGLDGQIREVLIYNRVLKSKEISQVECYLAKRSKIVKVGNLNGDGDLNAADIDLLTAALRAGSTDTQFDLDCSLAVDDGDVTYLVETLLGTNFGDANLDGSVTASGDGALLLANLGGVQGNKGWADADFDGDQNVTASRDGGVFLANLGSDAAAVSEPATLLLTCALLPAWISRRRRPPS